MKISLSLLLFIFTHALFGAPVPIGRPDKGSLQDAMPLPESGEGYVHMYREDEHFWATRQMITMIEKSAAEISEMRPGCDRLQVEDISAEHGGDIEGHSSHENGLDADIGYYKADYVEHDPVKKNQFYADPMVINGKVSPNFDVGRNWELMKSLHRNGDVQRIFMDVVLKKELCAYSKTIGEYSDNIHVLRSLRHEVNHQDHFHVRLRCPKEAKKCVNLPEPPAGSGCP